MLSKYFFTALKKITAHAQNFSSTLLDFENKRNEDGLSELKILVSVVRFRPGPPRISIAHLLGYFLLRLSGIKGHWSRAPSSRGLH
jgi:hypothetical protein